MKDWLCPGDRVCLIVSDMSQAGAGQGDSAARIEAKSRAFPGRADHDSGGERNAHRRRRGRAAYAGDGQYLRSHPRGEPRLPCAGSGGRRRHAPRHAGEAPSPRGARGQGGLSGRVHAPCDGGLRRRPEEHSARRERHGYHLPQPRLRPRPELSAQQSAHRQRKDRRQSAQRRHVRGGGAGEEPVRRQSGDERRDTWRRSTPGTI